MLKSNFIDHVRIYCKSGKGGAGSAHLFRDKKVAKGGPDGGDGGRGGNIILKGNKNLWTLIHLRYRKHIIAGDGGSGGSSNSTGATGEDIIVEVPLGTVAKYSESEEVIFEITENDQMYILVPGGRGGKGNTFFKSPTHQTPRFAQPGEEGIEEQITLELKLLADVGLVGFPNAGKSTLLSVVSAAKPEIADYPFTTLVPNLGIVNHREQNSFVMADIPGIIEGAGEGKGLGLRFLRHIERNSTLLFLIPADCKDYYKEYEILIGELNKFNPELMDKDRLIAISKADLLDDELMHEIRNEFPVNFKLHFFSSITGKGLVELKDKLWKMLNK